MKQPPTILGPTILGIETSCDETGVAIYRQGHGIIANALSSQIALHKKFGGVVPEVASREQLAKIVSVTQSALDSAKITLDDVDGIAVTTKPGLPGSLLVGLSFAKSLAWTKQKKIVGINHLEGHTFSSFIEHDVPFPHLCITASGGHTSLHIVNDFGDYDIIGQTLDDAAGEAFDKIAKIMDLGYPGGPIIEKLADQAGYTDFFSYPHPLSNTLDFSFSGLKTAIMYDLIKKNAYDLEKKEFLKKDDLVFQQQVASSLLVCMANIFERKIILALKKFPAIKAITFVGGVACNAYIKDRLSACAQRKQLPFFSPSPQYCTDNGAMIAFVGSYKLKQNICDDLTLDIF